jgi:TPR repeat protein
MHQAQPGTLAEKSPTAFSWLLQARLLNTMTVTVVKEKITFILLLASSLALMFFLEKRDGPDKRSFKAVRSLAEKGDPRAQFNLALLYGTGKGITKDTNEAIRWVAKAAAQGEPKSEDLLGTHHMSKQTSQDDVKGAGLFRQSAEQGFAKGQYHLGRCYLDGRGVPKDERSALEWFQRAAEQGDMEAQYTLGTLYVTGFVVKDDAQGVEWVRKAAEGGLAPAQFSMGTAYATGTGVKRDLILAHKWIALALAQGSGDRPALNGLILQMTPQQIAEAERLATEYKRSHPPGSKP